MNMLRNLFDETWQSLRVPMTSGQRQSALLLVPLTVALVLFGRPTDSDPAAAIVAPTVPPAVTAPVDELSDPTGPISTTTTIASASPSGPPELPNQTPSDLPAVTASPQTPAGQPSVVAVVRPGRDGDAATDAEMADAFLASSGLDGSVITLDPDPDTDTDVCDSVLARGSLVLASTGLGPRLRTCLVEGGATVVAHDALGDLAPGAAGAGQVLSTRRGFVDGLVELATWARDEGRLEGPTGLVTTESARAVTEQALPLLEDAGVDVAAVAYVPDDDPLVATSRGVIDFVQAGVSTTIFAAPVEVQRGWIDQSSIVSPGMSYLVSDAFDAVLDADYPEAFDGARISTTLRFPWSLAPTPRREACDRTWAEASGGTELSIGERLRMYSWCQHVTLASDGGAGAGGADADALRKMTHDSPLTTPLGPLGGDAWGPTEEVVLRWQATCACWVPEGEPTRRTIHSRS